MVTEVTPKRAFQVKSGCRAGNESAAGAGVISLKVQFQPVIERGGET
jgi:hypothetical protein